MEEFGEKLNELKFKQLEQHFEDEDFAKSVLFYAKDLNKAQIEQRQKFLNGKIAKRKNLYIYPAKVNV